MRQSSKLPHGRSERDTANYSDESSHLLQEFELGYGSESQSYSVQQQSPKSAVFEVSVTDSFSESSNRLDFESRQHKGFFFKLDFFLLSSSMLGYFVKTLNQHNINTAYINGMNEYFNMNKNQLNYLNSCWTLGYIIGQVPSSLILHKLSARIYLGVLEIIWGFLTISMVFVNDISIMYVIRFLIGLTESGFFPAIEFLLGSWYNSDELSKRSTFFAISGSFAGVVSGPLQQAILKFHEKSSLPSFKWMFVYDAMISFPVAIYTIIVGPNTPSTTDAWYFSEEDKRIALQRKSRKGAQLHNTTQNYTWKKIKGFAQTWHIWVFPLLFLAYNNSGAASGQPTFTSWLKYDLNLDSSYYNYYPSLVSAISIILALLISFISDNFHNKLNYLFIILHFTLVGVGCILLAIWNIPLRLHWASYFMIGMTSWGQPQIFSWINTLLAHDDMKRNFVLVITNVAAYISGVIVPIFVWNTEAKPRYFVGFIYTAFLSAAGVFLTLLVSWLSKRDQRRKIYL